jgi:hypothetical protein
VQLPVISKLVGHNNIAMTMRYAHFAADPVKEASELTGRALASALKSTKSE